MDSGSGVDWGGPSDDNAWYFVDGTDIQNNALKRHAARGSHNDRMYIISNLFRELEAIQAKGYTTEAGRKALVQEQINVLEPYVRSMPFALAQWLIFNMLWNTLSGFSFALGALDTLFNNLGYVIGDLLPPFADMNDSVASPSLNIYIDLNPQGSMYGVGDKVVAAGIQAIELMVNCTKNEGDYGETVRASASSGASSVANITDAYVLAINPRNLKNGTETSLQGQGLPRAYSSAIPASAPRRS